MLVGQLYKKELAEELTGPGTRVWIKRPLISSLVHVMYSPE